MDRNIERLNKTDHKNHARNILYEIFLFENCNNSHNRHHHNYNHLQSDWIQIEHLIDYNFHLNNWWY